ncbi:MAG: GNAT family N-acetyltransferase [Pseudomonadota bacterium]
MLSIAAAASPHDLRDAVTLFREYAELVAEALCFQDFDRELASLPGEYAPPGGVLLIARDAEAAARSTTGGNAAGCVALRRLDAASGEMKRMYVRAAYRGAGLGRRLAAAVIEEARRREYRRLLLDTLPRLSAAIALYRDLGFRETGPYLARPTPGALCFELELS